MKSKVISNVFFATLCFAIIGLHNLLSKYANPKIITMFFLISILAIFIRKLYRYFITCDLLILKAADKEQIASNILIILYLFTRESGLHNPTILGMTQCTWLGIGVVALSILWIFYYVSFSKNGVRKPRSFVKTHYSKLTSFQLTDELVSYTTIEGERYERRIMRPNIKTKTVIQNKINQYLKNK